jgi:DNA-binding response OmpR family regulator
MILEIEGVEIRLSHRENEIIRKLYAGRNNRIDRKELLLDIWGDDSFFNSRNLDVYIRKIRTYFQKDESIKIITLKGVGYHFYIEN